jgi:hypothetical protein
MVEMHNMPAMASTMTVDYHIHVSNLYSMTPTQVGDAIDSATNAQIDDMLAHRIGTCSYTVTVVGTSESSYSIGLSPTIISTVLPFVAGVVGTVFA